MDTEAIETINNQLIARRGDMVICMAPLHEMTTEQALRHAAWLVAIVGDEDRFHKIYEAVCNT